jgi:3-(3-hydroxy-phenyl)propionate hydroxylase
MARHPELRALPLQPTATNSPRAAGTLPNTRLSHRRNSRSGHPGHHPIVIVGAGITGLTLACALAQRQGVIAPVLLDEDNTVGVKGASSRGICYTQKSLEIFHRLGIYERIAAKGIQWSVGRTFAGHDEVYSFDLRQQSSLQLSAQPPFINIQQFYIEGYWSSASSELGHVTCAGATASRPSRRTPDGATLTSTHPRATTSSRPTM